MLAAKNFQSGMQTLRQIEFSLFDLLLHSDYDPASVRSEEIRDGTEGPFVVARIRTYEWTGDRIVAAWSTESRSPLRSGAWS